MLIKSNKGYINIPPLQNIIQDEGLEEIAYEDDEKCELLYNYFSFISSLEDANILFQILNIGPIIFCET